jgi:antitoxin MazE
MYWPNWPVTTVKLATSTRSFWQSGYLFIFGLDMDTESNYNIITIEGKSNMRVEIIRIGNSRGLRIPKAVLEQCGLKTFVDLRVKNHSLIVTPCEDARAGWEKSFQLMAKNEDDTLLDIESLPNSWDEDEWQW